jgi:hypothetical protein
MTHLNSEGMTTAEYAVGTLGACTLALVLHQLATDGYWFDHVVTIFERALRWHNFLDGVPLPRIRLP